MAILTKAQLKAENSSSFPNNNSQAITPQILRDYNVDIIDTLVDSNDTGSFARTDLTNDFTQTNNFTSISASAFVSASNFIGDGSKLTNITASIALPILDEGILQGYATSMNFTGSAISAQVIAGTAVVQVNIDNVGLVTTASFNAYTQSTNQFTASTNQFTQSVNTSITNLNASSASQQVSINALNVYTASQDSSSIVNSITELNTFSASAKIELVNLNTSVTNLNSFSSSTNSSITQLNASTASQQVSINALNTFTASQEIYNNAIANKVTSLEIATASLFTSVSNLNTATSSLFTSASLALVTASFDTGTRNLTFTKGNNTTFAVNIPDVSGSAGDFVTTASFNSYTQSNDQRVSSLEVNSASVNTSVTNINQFTQSAQVSINSLNSATSSYVTESETASFARTNVDNNFTANQTFTNITAVSASFTYVQTLYETASVIYSSGSNQFGDELTDVQTLSGSVKVQGSLTVNGTPVLTSSVDISGLVTTSSFNAYTQSNDSKVNSLINATASYANSASVALVDAGQQSQIDNLIAWTSSVVPTDISALNAFTQSADIRLNNLESTTSSLNTSVANLNSFTQSQETKNSTLANVTSSLQSFTQSADSRLDNLEAATSSYVTSAITASSLITASAVGNTITFTKGDASTFNVSVTSTPIDTGSFATTASFNSYTSSNDQRVSSLETNSASVNISISNINTATASLFTSASLGLTTASFSGNTLTFTKGDNSTFGVVIPDVSGSAGTTIFEVVYTGENITKGDPLYISGSQGANPKVFKADAADPLKMPVTFVSNETIGAANTTNAIVLGLIEGIDLTGYVAGQSIYVAEGGGWSANLPSGSNSVTQLLGVVTKGGSGGKGLVLNPGPAQLPGLDTGKMWVGNGNNQPVEITTASFASSASFNSYTSSTDGRLTNIESTTASLLIETSNLETFSSSALISISNLNASSASQQISINALNTLTSSLATTGSNSFNGNQTITGSLIMSSSNAVELTVIGNMVVTGSAFGNVVSMSITSNTASMDLSRGNYFTLTLADTATTHISASNVQPGVSATLVITTGTNSSASLAPTMLQPSGSAYSATLGSAKRDVLSIVAVASGVPYVVSTKNMI